MVKCEKIINLWERDNYDENSITKITVKVGKRAFNNEEMVKRVARFYQSVPFYRSTPLASLKNFAQSNQIGALYIKDEAHRSGITTANYGRFKLSDT